MTLNKITPFVLGILLFSCNQTNTADKESNFKDTIAQTKTIAESAAEQEAQVEFKLDSNAWSDFSGSLGKKQIRMSLHPLENGELKGNYCLHETERKIEVLGEIKQGKMLLTEFSNGKPTGRFEGRIITGKGDQFEGTWTDNANSNAIAFTLTLESICYASLDHRYSDFYGTDEDAEKFMKDVKTAILNGDKEWIGDHVSYPLTTTLFKNKSITIKSKKQLLANFDLVFHQAFKDRIHASCVCNMFKNYQGVMLGNGEIWIYTTPNSTENKYDFCIIAINN